MQRFLFSIMVLATAIVFGQSFAETFGTDVASSQHAAHSLVLFMHQLLLVYWLGPDIAIFIWSRRSVDTTLGAEHPIVAGQKLAKIHSIPRAPLTLFLLLPRVHSSNSG